MGFIISANYRDRQSLLKWLVRRRDEPAEKARECQSLTARFVRLEKSSEVEEGFGCRVVAAAELVHVDGDELSEDEKRWNWDEREVIPPNRKVDFGLYEFLDSKERPIKCANTLRLEADGSILID